MPKNERPPLTNEALAALAEVAAQFLIAQTDGDKTGAQALLNKATVIRDNPNSRQK
ncbi:hypothetical protein AB0395_46255 [Streptosporangium sp. NPDC051023]|uniref:hypothetical protein n=1 Tax=Streptosporangium sp. NPDC051023 TaxID=3155410 RepID=UPI00344E0AE3